MSAVINVFASIGLVAILVVIIYYIWKYIDQLNKESQIAQTRPSAAYMQSIGIKCPDYWTYLDTDENGNYVCRDDKKLMEKYNKNNSKCISTISYTKDKKPYSFKDSMIFSKLDDTKKWDTMKDEEKINFMKLNVNKHHSRAEWIKMCGPQVGNGVNTQAVWSGLNKYA
jgi:hypothetical protein